ncbi:MAG: helix-turn-helix transcriptional regulator [Candidatus Sungbacteria bacterium]|uniref:Helix-turn-helix transcriptional regulator n=1 Tax=Candidatus Sungiibacteriota bacterium TaxID=2750080 RepID=A0A931SDD3_9BACT|nr:helix-turn-helix transcriptional regulator [Candidatus Sungbacteria bacterium]
MKLEASAWSKLQKIHFPRAILSARLALGLTRRELASRAGVTARTISLWERGIRMPRSADMAASLADALYTRMDYLFLPDHGGPWDMAPPN